MNETQITKLASLIHERKTQLEQSRQYYLKRVAQYDKEAAEAESVTTRLFDLKIKLEEVGLRPYLSTYNMELDVEIEEAQLIHIYEIIGRLDGEQMEKAIVDSKKRLVKVTMPSVKHPEVKVSYAVKLPKTAKCKIVTERTPASSRKVLVCSVN